MMKKREEIINKLKKFFRENAKNYNIEMAFLFGSWARGFPMKNSDIDIAIIFSKELEYSNKLFDYIIEISLILTKKLSQEVNIIHIQRSLNRPMLYYNAIVLGIPIYIKEKQSYIKIRNEAIFQMEDFSLFGIPWQIKLIKKNLKEIENAKI